MGTDRAMRTTIKVPVTGGFVMVDVEVPDVDAISDDDRAFIADVLGPVFDRTADPVLADLAALRRRVEVENRDVPLAAACSPKEGTQR